MGLSLFEVYISQDQYQLPAMQIRQYLEEGSEDLRLLDEFTGVVGDRENISTQALFL